MNKEFRKVLLIEELASNDWVDFTLRWTQTLKENLGISVEVFEAPGTCEIDDYANPPYGGVDIESLKSEDALFTMLLKYDNCAHLSLGYMHFCGMQNVEKLYALLKHIYLKAPSICIMDPIEEYELEPITYKSKVLFEDNTFISQNEGKQRRTDESKTT